MTYELRFQIITFVFLLKNLLTVLILVTLIFSLWILQIKKAYHATLLISIIILGMIYGIHTSRKLEHVVRKNIVFTYIAGFKTPCFHYNCFF
ncbi:MAG: transposase [Methanosphaera sp.]|nr:transposase [Methanosphaera sp.]